MYAPDDPLGKELIRLARRLKGHEIKLIVGGGYGLFLKTAILTLAGERTRIEPVPFARSTTDLDFFLHAEIISNIEKCEVLRALLDEEYDPIKGSEYWQFAHKQYDKESEKRIKVDLLAAPPGLGLTSIDKRRIRPKGRKGILHARLTKEAAFVDQSAVPIFVGDDDGRIEILVPHPLAYLILKLNALSDRLDDNVKGPYHAFDVYRIVAMVTEKEWDESMNLANQYSSHPQFKKTVAIVNDLFANDDGMGVILARRFAKESEQPAPEIADLIADLKELFLRTFDM